MSGDADATVAEMRSFLPPPTDEELARVRDLDVEVIESALKAVHVEASIVRDVTDQWPACRRDEGMVSLLASLVRWVEACRGHEDEPIPIWDDLEEGPSGRLFYFYLFALFYESTVAFLNGVGCPPDVIETTMSDVARHVQLHQRKWGTVGFEAGWWLLLILRGEMVQVGSLQFHRVNLGVGTLSPDPWFSEEESRALGVGFGRGDPSVGIHIPDGAALDAASLEYTFERARDVVGIMWPVAQRRLATCQSWLLDDQLKAFLSPSSHIVEFQNHFTLLDGWYDNDERTLGFIFQRPGAELKDLPRATTLQRGVLDLLERGGHWRARPGWFDFDGR